ncbi:choline transporter-like protein 1 isoform X2 [Belonocnema kinseyi]|uniref:choline transporter-like protein 1 isoform X2 n=1 Tax=Belonocnema kinseyi TaxID=2817044 RepID=UPI00143D447B|nr:choline transporter-like protein 1 isoform X2 [Belonocnema kinseyi]
MTASNQILWAYISNTSFRKWTSVLYLNCDFDSEGADTPEEAKPPTCFEEDQTDQKKGSNRGRLSLLQLQLKKMGCCGCGDDKSPDDEETCSDDINQVFKTDRSCTDILALILLIVLLGAFGFCMSTAAKKGDIYRVINGYDDCANTCGRITPKESDPQFRCKGANMTDKKYLLVNVGADGVKSRTCTKNCSVSADYITFLNRCIPKKVTDTAGSLIKSLGLQDFFHEAARDLSQAWREIIYLLLIALAISLVILIAFRYIVQYVIYLVLTGAVVVCISGTTYLWILWYQERKLVANNKIHEDDASITDYLIYAIIMTIVTVITVLVVLVMRKRIALVVQLFREAGKAVYAMPVLLFQPVYTYLLVILTVLAWVYCMLLIESAGDLYNNTRKNHLHYKKDTIIKIARWYNLFLFFVMCEFYLGCQHMVVAGSVARWFFTRDKSQLSLAVTRSAGTLVRFHLGTVSFGAMIIGVVRFLRAVLANVHKRLKKYDNDCVRGILWCCHCCLWCFECALKFLTRNAYIETAIYGCNFCTGGKKAFQALSNNILRVAAINSVGDFVLFLGKVLVVALTVVSGVCLIEKKQGLQHPWVPILVAAIFAFLVAHVFISIYEMVIDTIFICFCEDCAKNDGISRPYFMSRGLMEFVENSKKALKVLEERQGTTS